MEKTRSSTKIICTIGPASESLDVIQNLFLSGMSIVRLNMSHGTRTSQIKIIENVRMVEKKYKTKIFIALDTRGPETRILCSHPVNIKEGDVFKIYSQKTAADVTVNVDSFNSIVEGSIATVDDCKLNLRIDSVYDDCITVTSLNDHTLENQKRIHFNPNKSIITVNKPIIGDFISEMDKEDLDFARKYNLDAIFVSFVEEPENVIDVRKLIDDPTVQIISKIESQRGIDNLSQIEKLSDGIMVARGDLMDAVGIQSLFSSQKKITGNVKKPVIMATEMLQSMSKSKVPFRSEISDVGNAVLDGCSAVMLSSETAVGMYPETTVDVMRLICIDAEKLCSSADVSCVFVDFKESRKYMFEKGVYCKIK